MSRGRHYIWPGGVVRTSVFSRRFRLSNPQCTSCGRLFGGSIAFQLADHTMRCWPCFTHEIGDHVPGAQRWCPLCMKFEKERAG